MNLKALKTTALAGVASALLAPVSANAETTILFNIFTPPSHFTWQVFQDWADQIHEASEGRLSIEFTAQSVAPPPRVMDAVRRGAADAGFVANIYAGPDHPGVQVGMLPWVHRGDSMATSIALQNTYERFFADVEEWPGLEVLSMYHFGGGSLCSLTDEPINTIEDLQALRLWSLAGNLGAMMSNAGVTIATGPAVQIHEMVSRNVVDALTGITYDSVINFRVADYTHSCVQFDRSPFSINFTHFINARVWNGLSAEDQAVLREYSGEHLARMIGETVNERALAGREELSQTASFAPVSPELLAALEAGAEPVIANWLETVGELGVDGQAALDFMISEVDRLSTINAN